MSALSNMPKSCSAKKGLAPEKEFYYTILLVGEISSQKKFIEYFKEENNQYVTSFGKENVRTTMWDGKVKFDLKLQNTENPGDRKLKEQYFKEDIHGIFVLYIASGKESWERNAPWLTELKAKKPVQYAVIATHGGKGTYVPQGKRLAHQNGATFAKVNDKQDAKTTVLEFVKKIEINLRSGQNFSGSCKKFEDKNGKERFCSPKSNQPASPCKTNQPASPSKCGNKAKSNCRKVKFVENCKQEACSAPSQRWTPKPSKWTATKEMIDRYVEPQSSGNNCGQSDSDESIESNSDQEDELEFKKEPLNFLQPDRIPNTVVSIAYISILEDCFKKMQNLRESVSSASLFEDHAIELKCESLKICDEIQCDSTPDAVESKLKLQSLIEQFKNHFKSLYWVEAEDDEEIMTEENAPSYSTNDAISLPLYSSETFFVNPKYSQLGRGGFASVYLAYNSAMGLVAIKTPTTSQNPEKFKIEAYLMHQASHPHIVQVFGYTKVAPSRLSLVLEYMGGGALSDLLFKYTEIHLGVGFHLKLRMVTEIASGVAYLHNIQVDERIAHNDLKPHNILLTDNYNCKLSDFGGAEMDDVTDGAQVRRKRHTKEYTRSYASPERLRSPNARTTKAMDVYSFGMTAFSVLTQDKPRFNLPKSRPIISEFGSAKLTTGQSESGALAIYNLLREIVQNCWEENPSDRPVMLEVRQKLEKLFMMEKYCMIAMKQAFDIAKKNGKPGSGSTFFNKETWVPLSHFTK